MPRFSVTIDRTTVQTCIIEVEAENEDAAIELAEAQARKDENGVNEEWTIDSDECEAVNVDPPDEEEDDV